MSVKKTLLFRRAFALQSSSRNWYPAPDLVFFKLISWRVFFSGRVLFFTDTGIAVHKHSCLLMTLFRSPLGRLRACLCFCGCMKDSFERISIVCTVSSFEDSYERISIVCLCFCGCMKDIFLRRAVRDTIKSARLYNSPVITRINSHKKYIFYNDYDPIQGLFENELGER